ncbi:hypothetical protein ACFODO_10290 [Acinetobacter sichuanensis]|uniref:Uncharacterized protein n=1 Tax=Acinetobacter sichuanensis TaxID=2136183 RepID=A0A371YN37_9GAMM|nr:MULTISPECIES: hypothetical protein [Acinetobacter]MDM1247339.1 hypothetical protein [Acinetobacter sp. R933-2]MDM1765412.1 hypothetical protein [Acinetobacter sp. 226-1]MDM1768917.1 hypothetical protein [Acinetobacter sp. 226-4]MDQ9022463.1 hypothetical protein [Acinetobacter sichuanensis]RFC82880.1 hypothetical protein C9E89_014250 [Acinetobacter sichuanensis]
MSYKHNNLMAMRQNFWNDTETDSVQLEKLFLQNILAEHGVFNAPTLEDVKYFFFSLPSIIIIKGYALGFSHSAIQSMITQYIHENKVRLMQHETLKIQYRM